MRAGRYVKQSGGFKAFIPAPLPPAPPIVFDTQLVHLLSNADRALARLDGVASTLPSPDLFVAMYVRHEAVLSSQIEGTQSTLEDVLQFETDAKGQNLPKDVSEVVNYIKAMNYGLKRLEDLPLSLRLIREIHGKLIEGVRGENRSPGEFRQTQNWIGSANSGLAFATFVPPPVHEMHQALDNLERFLHDEETYPALIHCGVAHAQFETIHPFLDGNGRVGRLLITYLLCQRKILERPLLYLSYYLKAYRTEYYDRLMAIRDYGDWEGWLKFFLRGIDQISQSATGTARAILRLRENHRDLISTKIGGNTGNSMRLLDFLYERPIINVRTVEKHLRCTYVTANKLIDQCVELGILQKTSRGERNRLYAYKPYLNLFGTPDQILPSGTVNQPEQTPGNSSPPTGQD